MYNMIICIYDYICMLNTSSYSHGYNELSIHPQASPWIYLFHNLHMFVDLSITLPTLLKLLDSYTTYIHDPHIQLSPPHSLTLT